jgi:dynein heavy chain
MVCCLLLCLVSGYNTASTMSAPVLTATGTPLQAPGTFIVRPGVRRNKKSGGAMAAHAASSSAAASVGAAASSSSSSSAAAAAAASSSSTGAGPDASAQYEKYLMSPFSFIDKAIDSPYTEEFVYLNPRGPYDLLIVKHESIDPTNYYTMSRAGVTHFFQTETDFTSLDQWERE